MRAIVCLFDDRYAGPSKRVVEVAPELRREVAGAEPIETLLLLPRGTGNAEKFAVRSGIRVLRLSFSRIPRPQQVTRLIVWLLRLPLDVVRFVRVFLSERADLVHNSGAFFLAPAIAAKVARLPLIWHLNDTIVPGRFAPWLGRLVRVLADVVVVEGRAVALHYGIPVSESEIVYAPVRPETFQSAESRKPPLLEGDRIHIGLVANWTPIKGIHIFAEALAALYQKMGPRIQVVFAGARWQNHLEYCRRVDSLIDQLGLRPAVVDHGFVEEIERVLETLDLLVLSSLTEACPMVVLEAMASGLPVVATDVGSVRELLLRDPDRPAGSIVPAGDPHALESAISGMLADPERARQMGENGRALVREYFSVDLAAQRHRELYGRVAK